MSQLSRPTPRRSSSGSRLLLVRQPARSVRREHQPDRLPLRLALGITISIGVVAVVWLLGHLGFRLGFAPLVRAPDLVGEPGGGLATGVLMLISAPRAIFAAGLDAPMWLMLAFVAIAVPAASLAAAKPAVPGGPRPKPAVVGLAATGAVAAVLVGGGLLWWTGCPTRTELLRLLPLDPAGAAQWYADLQTVAGLDVLFCIAAAVWMVLAFRVPVPIWLRAIAVSATVFTLVVTTVAMAISSAAATQAGAARSVCLVDDGNPRPRVILGSGPHHVMTLSANSAGVAVEWRSVPETMPIIGQQSIVGFLNEAGER